MMLLAVACLLFGLGLSGVLVRRDVVAVLASVEVMLGGAMVLLVGLGATLSTARAAEVHGIALMVLVVIAAEAAIGLALLVAVARQMRTTRVDELTEVRG
ncbi:MAG TPA: NADH-quinone oxidoreductase subunit NuoK [Coriobacteriia bacterium]